MKVSKEVIRKNVILDLAARAEILGGVVLQLRVEQLILNRIAESLPKDRDGNRSPVSKLIDASAGKLVRFSQEINNQAAGIRDRVSALKAVRL